MKDWRTETNEKEKYSLYLCSREWSEKREVVRKRAGGICERCKHNKMDAVHHLTYARKYREELDDLQAICKACHEFTHGKIDKDPVRNKPIIIDGTNIRSVYLAGKIRKRGNFRDSIVGYNGHRVSGDTYGHHLDWIKRPIVKIQNRDFKLTYTGPYIMDCSHGCFSQAGHSYSAGFDCMSVTTKLHVMDHCLNAIAVADLVFAWIDTDDCFGTINEIGYAYALGKKILVAGPNLYRELWFSYHQADKVLFDVEDAGEAFQLMVCEGAGDEFKDLVEILSHKGYIEGNYLDARWKTEDFIHEGSCIR